MKDKQNKEDISKMMEQSNKGIVREFIEFAMANKKLWLIPIFLILFLLGFLIVIGGSSAAPFIYRLF